MATLNSQKSTICDLLDEALARTIRMVLYRPSNQAAPDSLGQLKRRIDQGNCPQLDALTVQSPLDGVKPNLYEHWIAKALLEAKVAIGKVNTTNVAAYRWQRRDTKAIFEARVEEAQAAFTRATSGVVACIAKCFTQPNDYRTEGIEELAQLSELTKKLQRRLAIFKSRFLSFAYSPKLLAALLAALVVSVPATYYVGAAIAARSVDIQALQPVVETQVKAHVDKVREAASDKAGKDFWAKTVDVSKQIKDIAGNTKTTIATLIAIWALLIKRLGR